MRLTVSISPHIKASYDTSSIMRNVIYALLPAVGASLYFFRWPAFFVISNCVITSIITEAIVLKIRNKPSEIKNGSAALTGLLLAMVLPPATKWYAASLGAIFAILIGKHLFGGLGSNIFNPALSGRAFLMAAYPKMMTTWSEPFTLSAVTSATPLALRKFSHTLTGIPALFLGNTAGCIGETSAVLLILGGTYLIIKKIADWRIPLSMIVTASVISFIFYLINPLNGSVLFHLFSGGFMLGTFFMATDPVTTPVTKSGRIIFGAGCAALIMTIRYFSGLPEGVMYSILFMNALTPLINRMSRPKSFGASAAVVVTKVL